MVDCKYMYVMVIKQNVSPVSGCFVVVSLMSQLKVKERKRCAKCHYQDEELHLHVARVFTCMHR